MGTGKYSYIFTNFSYILIKFIIFFQTEIRVEALLESFRPGRERDRDKQHATSHGASPNDNHQTKTAQEPSTNNDLK